jgi:hypothetical protein
MIEDLRRQLRDLRSTMLWAFAHGHGCTIGDHPEFAAIRREDQRLVALIQEHDPASAPPAAS